MAQVEKNSKEDLYGHVADLVLVQMSAKKGMKWYGEKEVVESMKQYQPFSDMEVFEKNNPKSLSQNQKDEALRAVNLIKHKLDDMIKRHTYANGKHQRKYEPRDKVYSPTVGLETLVTTLIIDAPE